MTTETESGTAVLADRFTAAIAAADMTTMRELYTPDAVIWHCTDGIELSVDELDGLLTAIGSVSTCAIEVTSRQPTAQGFVQTQVNSYTLADGGAVVLRCALLVRTRSGRIERVDEYLDGAALAPLLAALPTT
ncbi:nuclear transport factor 2 family protein [Pseudonocardia xishanensis]|uniref:Nuclear transport factor 2 family protein n=1 Tax=Pseudonocardia xishanensis TaxID=630995 RepID=A0ABP8REV0_9PSEU